MDFSGYITAAQVLTRRGFYRIETEVGRSQGKPMIGGIQVGPHVGHAPFSAFE